MTLHLEKQCASLEPSIKLRNLGVRQKSCFAWMNDTEKVGSYLDDVELFATMGIELMRGGKAVSAFTVAELGEMLPEREEKDFRVSFINIHKNKKESGTEQWTVKFVWRVVGTSPANDARYITYGDNLADAMAKMLIYLLENKIIEVDIIND